MLDKEDIDWIPSLNLGGNNTIKHEPIEFVKTEVIEEDNEQPGDVGNIEFIGLLESEILDKVKIEKPDPTDSPNTGNKTSRNTVIIKFTKSISINLCMTIYLFQVNLGRHICRMCLENNATKPKFSVFHSINKRHKLSDLILCLLNISVSYAVNIICIMP